jgi:outer membrane lipoprotein-sorting protein
MKTIKLTAIIFACCQFIFAQNALAGPTNGTTLSAEDFYRKFSRYDKFSSLKTTFIQKKIIPDLNVQLEAEGTLSVKRPDTVVWEITKPSELKVLLDKNNLSIVSETKKESWPLEKIPPNIKEKLFIMKLWLQFDPRELYQRYTSSEIKPNRLKFVPKEKSPIGFSSLEMHLHQKGYVSKLILLEDSGDLLDFTFSKPEIEP